MYKHYLPAEGSTSCPTSEGGIFSGAVWELREQTSESYRVKHTHTHKQQKKSIISRLKRFSFVAFLQQSNTY